jgi:Tol biopolymer transport system component
MGEVYRARDPRLHRDVAVKVLPSEVATDSGRLQRFEKEARAAGALNHPNVLAVYDIGNHEGVPFVVSELLEGETLGSRLREGKLPPRKAVDLAVQIARGLAAAHERGIVHRDLKPENLFVTKDGRVKILDFGLAKLLEPESARPESITATRSHEILGTMGYMAPEQVKGTDIDPRADIFAFGAVFYEMLSKRKAFQRETRAETLVATLNEDPPDLSAADPSIPIALSRIVRRCLEKRPEERFQSAPDLGFALEALSGSSDAAPALKGSASEKAHSGSRHRVALMAGVATLVLAAMGWAGWRLRHADYFWQNPLAGARFSRFTDWEGSERDAAISSDGQFVAFLAERDGPFDVWVGQVGSGEFLDLTKGSDPNLPNFLVHGVGFSGDAAHVWFRTNSEDGKAHSVMLVPTIGGAPRRFLPSAVEAAWSPDHDRILYFSPDPGDPIFIADRNGGSPMQLCVAKPGIHQHYVAWSPDGRFVYFARGIPPDEMDIWRVAAAGGEVERMTHHNSLVAYPTLLDGRTLVYTATREDGSGSGLYAMDVDERVSHAVTAGIEEYVSVGTSADGRRLVATVANSVRDLWAVPITDHVVDESAVSRFKLPTVRAAAPRFGPDYLLYLGSKGAADGLWKLKDGSQFELWKGSEGAVSSAPGVSPDGTRICLVVRREGRGLLALMASDGTNMRHLAGSLDVRGAPSWSPDGKWLAVTATEGKANPLFKVPVDGGAPVRLVDGTDSVISNPVWSPNGRVILYSEGRDSAKVRLQGITPDKEAYPLPEVWVGNSGDRYRFLPDGNSLVVSKGVLWMQNFFLLDLTNGQQRQLTNLSRQILTRSFDVSPDGKQILIDRYRQNSDIVLIDRVRPQ